MAARLTLIRPMLETPDLAGTISFWTEQLGFTVTARIDDDRGRPLWCNLQRDEVRVMFNSHYHDDPEEDGEEHTAMLTGALYMNVDDVDAIAAGIDRSKVEVLNGPADQPHGMREVVVRDNNGYVVVFGQPLTEL